MSSGAYAQLLVVGSAVSLFRIGGVTVAQYRAYTYHDRFRSVLDTGNRDLSD